MRPRSQAWSWTKSRRGRRSLSGTKPGPAGPGFNWSRCAQPTRRNVCFSGLSRLQRDAAAGQGRAKRRHFAGTQGIERSIRAYRP